MNILEFKEEDVKVYLNLSKAEIIAALNAVKDRADKFDGEAQSVLAVAIIWIGFTLKA